VIRCFLAGSPLQHLENPNQSLSERPGLFHSLGFILELASLHTDADFLKLLHENANNHLLQKDIHF